VPAKNIYHDAVVTALREDGWTITGDPLTVSYGERDLYVDLGAERVALAAEKGNDKIAVEVQSFLDPSPVHDLQMAVGQYAIYRLILEQRDPVRLLFMAVPLRTYNGPLTERFGQLIVKGLRINLLVFDHRQERIVQWINWNDTAKS
jgi:XisH protein